MGTLLGILSLLATAVGIGSNVSSSNKQEDYEKKTEQQNKDIINERALEDRRAALSRAIKSENIYAPTQEPFPVEKPDLTAEGTVGGIATAAGGAINAANSAYSSGQWGQLPTYKSPDINSYVGAATKK